MSGKSLKNLLLQSVNRKKRKVHYVERQVNNKAHRVINYVTAPLT